MNEEIQLTELEDNRYLLKKFSGAPIGARVIFFVLGLIAAWIAYMALTSSAPGKEPILVVSSTVTSLLGGFSAAAMAILFIRTWTQIEWDDKQKFVEEYCLFGPPIGIWRKDDILGIALDYFLTSEPGSHRNRMPTRPTYRLLFITKDGHRSQILEHAFSDTKKALEDRGKALAAYMGVDYLGGGFEKFVYVTKSEDGTVKAVLKKYSLLTWYKESEDGKLGCLAAVLAFIIFIVTPFVYMLASKAN